METKDQGQTEREGLALTMGLWMEKLEECVEDEQPLSFGLVLGLANDLRRVIAALSRQGAEGGEPVDDAAIRRAVVHGYLAAVNDSAVFEHPPKASAEQQADLYLARLRAEPQEREPVWQCCPVCIGKGIVPNGFYATPSGVSSYGSSSCNPEKCRRCDGLGTIAAPTGHTGEGEPEPYLGNPSAHPDDQFIAFRPATPEREEPE